jgi:hypothetical protein
MRIPPSYLKDHAGKPDPSGPALALANGAWCGHGEPNFVIYDIHDTGENVLRVMLPTGDYPELCAVAACRENHPPFLIYDPRLHPASLYADNSNHYPYHPAAPYQCACGSIRFKVAVGFEVPADSEEPEDTSWFALAVLCEDCGMRQVIFDDETA